MKRLAAALALLATVLAHADTVTLKSGRTLTGTVIERTDAFVRIRQTVGGLEVVSKHKVTDVASIEAADRSGTPYARIPIIGTFGEGITADAFSRATDAARADGATTLLLHFDSPGGSVQEMAKILDVIHTSRDLRFVAVVKRAISAAAVTAVACADIIMLPDSTIGAAVAFKVGPEGTPENIEEKFASVARAIMREAAAIGRHDVLWIRGMTEPEVELHFTAGKISDARTAKDSRLIKPRGRILTLTGSEAAEYGLARGNATSMADVRSVLGIPHWYEAGERSWNIGMSAARQPAAASAELGELKGNYAEAVREFEEQKARGDSAVAMLKTLKTRYNADVVALNKWSDEQFAAAARDSNPDAVKGRVREAYTRRRGELDQRSLPEIDSAERTARDAIAQLNRLSAHLKDLETRARGIARP